MPNIRIKDIPTTASATVNGDFLPIDSTVSTRKLNAFSPTFGGNATVSGNLTVSGGTTTLADSNGSFGTLTGSYNAGNQFVRLNRIGATEHIAMYADNSTRFTNNGAETARITSTGNLLIGGTTDISGSGGLKVFGTTASTTTTTGALVVSGGLGVGGAASIGGPILVGTSSDVYLSRVGAGILDIRSASSPGTAARLDVTGTTSAGVGFRQSGTRDWFITAESAELRVTCGTSGSIFAVTNGNPVRMRDTTASTSTSSGALVVSGGVGVAGAIYLGVKLNISTHDSSTGGIGFGTDISLYRSAANTLAFDTTGNAAVLNVRESGTLTAAIGTVTGDLYLQTQQAGKKVYIKTANAATAATFDENQKATFAATIKTAAPSGGTAAEWKLGTVATVSPTSPNRTIEVDIGGTIYYLAAKTTNN